MQSFRQYRLAKTLSRPEPELNGRKIELGIGREPKIEARHQRKEKGAFELFDQVDLLASDPCQLATNLGLPVENPRLIGQDYQRQNTDRDWHSAFIWGSLGLLATVGVECLLWCWDVITRWCAKPKRGL
jgi:hypothetical protein